MSENPSSDLHPPLDALDGQRWSMSPCPADAAVSGVLLPLCAASPVIAREARQTATVVSSPTIPSDAPAASSPSWRRSANDAQQPAQAARKGSVVINANRLRRLRESRLLSQQDLSEAIFDRNLQVSIATIKRAETGHAVRFRIVRALAKYFEVPFDDLL